MRWKRAVHKIKGKGPPVRKGRRDSILWEDIMDKGANRQRVKQAGRGVTPQKELLTPKKKKRISGPENE